MRVVHVLPVVGAVALVASMLGGCSSLGGEKSAVMSQKKMSFGTTAEGADVPAYKLTNASGASVTILAYGGIVQDLEVPDKDGKISNVVLGFDAVKPYETISPFFGALIGRTGNRIAKGEFSLDGRTFHLPINDPPNDLHGGDKGYHKRLWTAHEPTKNVMGDSSVVLSLVDPDGMAGYPGTVKVEVIYTLTHSNTLRIDYRATTDQATPINLTHHSYFNLKDGGKSDILGHVVKLNCEAYTPVDATLIPTGVVASVKGTPLDFTKAKPVGQDFAEMPTGYDHNFVVSKSAPTVLDFSSGLSLREAAVVSEPTSGRTMEVWTSEPGLQFYSGNMMTEMQGKGGTMYEKHFAFCLEAQHFPDSPNHANFPTVIVQPGQTYRQVTEYRFGVEK